MQQQVAATKVDYIEMQNHWSFVAANDHNSVQVLWNDRVLIREI